MINHVRTLLLNERATLAGLASGNPGAEYVDAGFQPLAFPQLFWDIRGTFLPQGFTAYQQNAVLAYITRILHVPELEATMLGLDPRFTYSLTHDYIARLRESAFVVDSAVSSDSDVTLEPDYQSNTKWTGGGSILEWGIQYDPTMGRKITVTFGNKPATEYDVIFRGEYSDRFVLIPERVTFRLKSPGNLLSGTFRHTLTLHAPVAVDVMGLLAQLQGLDARQRVSAIVFDPWEAHADTITALRLVWDNSPEPTLRVGAFLLAYAYQCERIRLGQPLPYLSGESSIRRLV